MSIYRRVILCSYISLEYTPTPRSGVSSIFIGHQIGGQAPNTKFRKDFAFFFFFKGGFLADEFGALVKIQFGALDLVLGPSKNKTILSVVMQINCWQDPNNGHPNNKNIPKRTFWAQKISQIKPFWHKKYPKSNFFSTKNLKFYFGLFLSWHKWLNRCLCIELFI